MNLRFLVPIFYFVFFACLLINYPLNGMPICDTDLWYNLAAFNHNILFIKSIFTGALVYSPDYLEPHPYLLGEPSLLLTFPYWLSKLLTSNDIWALWLLTSITLSINSTAVFLLSRHFTQTFILQVICGLVFSYNAYIFSNTGFLSTIFIGPGILAAASFLNYVKYKNIDQFVLCLLLLSVQLFCATYLFLYSCLFCLVIAIVKLRDINRNVFSFKLFCFGIIPFSFSLILFFYLFFVVSPKSGFYNGINSIEKLKYMSINWNDFLRGGFWQNKIPHEVHCWDWMYNWKSLNLGIVVTIMTILGFLKGQIKSKFMLISVLLVSMLLGLGPFVYLGDNKVILPYQYAWEHFSLAKDIRFPFRIFSLCLIPICIFFAAGIGYIRQMLSPKIGFAVILVLLTFIAIENYPEYSQKGSEIGTFISKTNNYLLPYKDPGKVILYMPYYDILDCNCSYNNCYMGIISEYVYMYLQNFQPNYVLNGCSGFYSPKRLQLNENLKKFNDSGNADVLIDSIHFDYLIFLKNNPFNYVNMDNRIPNLNSSLLINKIFEDSVKIVYKRQ